MKKTRIAYYVIVYEGLRAIHKQYIFPNELHLIATFYNHHVSADRIEIFREELPNTHWLFQ